MTAADWPIGRHMVELEQEGRSRAEHGEQTLERLTADLPARHARGLSVRHARLMRVSCLAWAICTDATCGFPGWPTSTSGFRAVGLPTRGCPRCRTSAPGGSAWPSLWAAAGGFADPTGRSAPGAASGARDQGTRPSWFVSAGRFIPAIASERSRIRSSSCSHAAGSASTRCSRPSSTTSRSIPRERVGQRAGASNVLDKLTRRAYPVSPSALPF